MDVLQVAGFLILATSLAVIVGVTWAFVAGTRRRAIARARGRAQAHLDLIAGQICDSLAAGETRVHSALCDRYERLSGALASARTVREVHRVELSARADALLWKGRSRVIRLIGPEAERVAVGLAREAAGAARTWLAVARSERATRRSA